MPAYGAGNFLNNPTRKLYKNSVMATYRFEIIPHDHFYFGSDKTYGPDNQNYFVRSRYFPQQTTVYGLLRYIILKEKGFIDSAGRIKTENEGDAAQWIGSTGFNLDLNLDTDTKIKRLSPVFITGDDGDYFVQSREYGLKIIDDTVSGVKKEQVVPLIFNTRQGYSSSYSISKKIPCFEGINSKTRFPELLVNTMTGNMRFFQYDKDRRNDPMNGIFIADDRVGNRKVGTKREEGFFRQIGYSFIEDFRFAFYAEIEDDNFTVNNRFFKMGADQSWCSVNVMKDEKIDLSRFGQEESRIFEKPYPLNKKIVLLSDTFLDQETYNRINVFISSTTVPFRFMVTKNNDSSGKYQNVRASFSLDKSKKSFQLLERGSVLFIDSQEKDEIVQIIRGNLNGVTVRPQAAFYKIGYNHVI